MSLLSMTRGDTRTWTVTVKNADGTPFDLTSCKMWFSVRDYPGAPAYVFQKTSDSDGITFGGNPALGIATVGPIATGDTSTLAAKELRLAFDVQLKTTDGEIFTLDSGALIVTPDITLETS